MSMRLALARFGCSEVFSSIWSLVSFLVTCDTVRVQRKREIRSLAMGAQVGGSFILRLIECRGPQNAIVILDISRFPKMRTCYCGLQEATQDDPSNMRKFEAEG